MKLLLIDGHYYVYRSFFAIRNLSNSRGEPTNAIYGFIKTVRRMLKDLQPEFAAVVWDQGLPTRRTELQPEYKQQRAEMPSDMRPQLEAIRQLVPMMGFGSVCLPDTEADDLMASYACEAVHRGWEVVLATNDKDLFQLITDKVKIYTTNKADLVSPKDTHALLDADCVQEKWGLPPERIGEILCLIGDSVDNIPGVPGLGKKTAVSLLQKAGSLDSLLANLETLATPRLREKLEPAREQILQNREMVKLDTDLALPEPLENFRIRPRYEELIATLERCEFRSLMDEIRADAAKAPTPERPRQADLFA